MIHMFYDHIWQDQFKLVVEHRSELVETIDGPKYLISCTTIPLPWLLKMKEPCCLEKMAEPYHLSLFSYIHLFPPYEAMIMVTSVFGS